MQFFSHCRAYRIDGGQNGNHVPDESYGQGHFRY